jgi:phosphoribosylformylglycinamidine cyclo-ligase
MAHITGGGLPENLPRMLRGDAAERLAFHVDLDSWVLPDVFAWLRQAGGIADLELLRTFNCGVGFVLCVPAEAEQQVLTQLAEAGEHAWRLGSLAPADQRPAAPGLHVPGTGSAEVVGTWA